MELLGYWSLLVFKKNQLELIALNNMKIPVYML